MIEGQAAKKTGKQAGRQANDDETEKNPHKENKANRKIKTFSLGFH